MSRSLMISNFVLFQVGWFACVLGGAYNYPITGSLIALAVIAIHIFRAEQPKLEVRLVILAFIIGIIFESMFTFANLSRYPSGILIEGMAPYWMVLMWGVFATTINVSMRWVKPLSLLIVSLLGAVLAPLSYFAGHRLGAVEFLDTPSVLATIAVGWAILFPMLVAFARRNDGYSKNISIDQNAGRYANV